MLLGKPPEHTDTKKKRKRSRYKHLLFHFVSVSVVCVRKNIMMDRVESYVFNISGDNLYHSSSSESSSIGRNSDDEEDEECHGGDAEENEAESPYKGPLDLMESLEEVLPVRLNLSLFF